MSRKLTLLALAGVLAHSSSAFAAIQLGEHFTFGGFGTLGAVATSTDDAEYVRENQPKGATKDPSLLVDSNLGLQLTGKATNWLSATVQTLTAQRESDHFSTKVEWAFIKVTPARGLNVRAGKLGLPNFLISDSRRVGYANNALRPANEVYGLDVLNDGLKGADISYRLPVGRNSLTFTGLYGSSANVGAASKLDIKHVKGINLVWDGNWYTLRLGRVEGKPDFPPSLAAVWTLFLPPGQTLDETYQFTGLGFSADKANVVLQGEYVTGRLKQVPRFYDHTAWYLMGGYRSGAFLPYVQYAERKPDKGMAFQNQQSTTALGLRWDAFSSVAIKFQLEHVDTKDTTGASFIATRPLTDPVTTFSAAVDFVF